MVKKKKMKKRMKSWKLDSAEFTNNLWEGSIDAFFFCCRCIIRHIHITILYVAYAVSPIRKRNTCFMSSC